MTNSVSSNRPEKLNHPDTYLDGRDIHDVQQEGIFN